MERLRRSSSGFLILGLVLSAALAAGAARAEPAKIRTLQIDASTRPGAGQFVPADDGVQHLTYELYVTNWNYKRDLRFEAVDVEDADTGRRLARLDSKALEDAYTLRITRFMGEAGPANRLLPAGRTGIVAVDLKLPLGASVPSALRHRIQFESDPEIQLVKADGALSSELFSVSEPMSIDRTPPLSIGPPLRGGPWRCGNGLGYGNSHDAIYASGNIARLHVPQRFGCDFSKVDSKGDTLPSPFPDIINSSMFYGYGADVIAVADGQVISTLDDVAENVPQIDGKIIPPVPLTDRTNPGNSVVLEIGKGQYAFYAHLQPGSLRVKAGDTVRKGQLLGRLGNSGNSSGPHLHFHVGSGPDLNGYDFVPHVYASYWLSGHARDGRPDTAKRKRIDLKVPTEGSFMSFPDR